MNKNLFFFKTEDNNYFLFNACQQRITKLPLSLYKALFDNSFSIDMLSKNQKSFYEKITDTVCNEIIKTSLPFVNVTLANSNICNLNCSYCHRKSSEQNQLSFEKVESILDFVIKNYAPSAKGYVVDFDLQGEPLRNIENLKLFQKIKDKYTDILSKQNKWIFFSFITNGTCVTETVAKRLKEIGIVKQTVSIDGPDYIHDFSRKYINGTGSHYDVVKGIKELQKVNIKIHASCVITARYPKLYEILEYFLDLKIDSVHFQLVRAPAPYCFNQKSLTSLLNDLDKIYEKLYEDIINDDLAMLYLLRDSIIMFPIKNILLNTKSITRCNWKEKIVIDMNGDIYPCLGFIGNGAFCYGNIKDSNLDKAKLEIRNTVDNHGDCKNCWARYLCGGFCHLVSINENSCLEMKSPIECRFRKFIIEKSLILFAKLFDKNSLDKIILPLCKDDLCNISNK